VAYGGNYERIKRILNKYGLSFRSPTQEEIESDRLRRSVQAKEFRRKNGPVSSLKSRRNKYGSKEEATLALRKVKNRPSREELLDMVWKRSVSSIAKDYLISDKAVRKWAVQYGIPVPPVGYWRKLSVGRKEECDKIKHQMMSILESK
jgi:hypothetical protein